MLIKDWMSKDVAVVDEEMSMMKASKLLKERDIRRLPVVDKKGRIVGILTDRDIKEASPSKATTLDVHELYYLLSEIKVKDIMTPKPITIHVNDTVEKAAVVMLDKKVEGLPVVDDDSKVVGIITGGDIFKVLVSITGVFQGGIQMGLKLPDEPGTLKHVVEDLRHHKARVISILTHYNENESGTRHVYIRIHDMDKGDEKSLKETLQSKHGLLFWVRDNIPGRMKK